MTEKRFTITQDFEEHHRQIRDDGYVVMGCFIEPQAEVIVDLLNQLNDENKQLKQENQLFKYGYILDLNTATEIIGEQRITIEELIKENELLKKENMKLGEILRKWYADANKLRTPIRKLDYGEDIGYWNGVKQFIEHISDELGVDLE